MCVPYGVPAFRYTGISTVPKHGPCGVGFTPPSVDWDSPSNEGMNFSCFHTSFSKEGWRQYQPSCRRSYTRRYNTLDQALVSVNGPIVCPCCTQACLVCNDLIASQFPATDIHWLRVSVQRGPDITILRTADRAPEASGVLRFAAEQPNTSSYRDWSKVIRYESSLFADLETQKSRCQMLRRAVEM